jgi:hypothetical protein
LKNFSSTLARFCYTCLILSFYIQWDILN